MLMVPKSRTNKVPVVAICQNPRCKTNEFEVTDRDKPVECPTCGNNKAVAIRMLIHWLMPDPAGKWTGGMGTNYSIECDPDLVEFAPDSLETASTSIEAVNCPLCLEEYAARFPEPAAEQPAEAS